MKKTLPLNLKKLNIVIASHIFATGPALDLEEYLKGKVKRLTFIGHPFLFRKKINSFLRIYSNGKKIKDKEAFPWKLPSIIQYVKDAAYTFFWILKVPGRIDYYFGSDGFLGYLGLLLKKMGKVSNVVLYTIDFMPVRFKNPILNKLYHYFDQACLTECKITWNLSSKMAEGRANYYKKSKLSYAPQLTVPLGIWFDRIPKNSFSSRQRYQVVFMGHILKKQGLDIVIEGMTSIVKKIPKIKLLIIGTGDYEGALMSKIKSKKLERYVEFSGYVESHEEVEKMLADSMLAVAPYKPDPESFTYFADPGKIKNYLAAGLPVILTDVPPIAKEIQKSNCAVIIEYNAKAFENAVLELLSNENKLKTYQKNAINFAKKFDWNYVFNKALVETIN